MDIPDTKREVIRMLRNVSISKKWSAAIFVAVLLLTNVIGYLLAGLSQSERNLNNLINHQYQQETVVNRTRIYVMQLARDLRDYYIQTEENDLKRMEYTNKIQEHRKLLTDEVILLDSAFADNPGEMSGYQESIEKWLTFGDEIVNSIDDGDRTKAEALILNDCPRALDELTAAAEKISVRTQEAVSAAVEQSRNSTQLSYWVSIVIFFVSLAAALLISWRVRRSILIPLHEIRDTADEMAQGRLDRVVSYQSKDELGQLAESMRQSRRLLSGYIQDLGRIMAELSQWHFDVTPQEKFIGDFENIESSLALLTKTMSESAAQLREMSREVYSSAEQVSYSSQDIAQGAAEQASSIQEIAANISEISGKADSTAQNAVQASGLADSVGADIVVCGEKMKEMTHAMDEISVNSDEIRKIIKTIEDIAFQTNILALNAAVEAARSGAAGKGFSVVADEVRNLAGKSAEASRSTSELIDRLRKSVKSGAEISSETAKTLFDTVERAGSATAALKLISQASEAQAGLVAQITQGIEQVSTVIQSNSATAEESAASSQQLSALADGLKRITEHFRIRENHGS